MTQKRKKRIEQRPPTWRPEAGICLALAACVFIVFGQTLRHPFFNFDDADYVYDNPEVARGLTRHGLAWAFTTRHAGNWHPLTWLSHSLDCQLYGLRPAGHHLANVLIHAAAAMLLFLALRRMTDAFWRCAFVAAVFAIHPLRAESVAWVAERKDVLSGLFFVLTIWAYAEYARKPRSPRRYALALCMFALGLMCKPMLVTLPVVLLLLDSWPLRRTESRGRLLLEKIPFLALAAAACVITLLAQDAAMQPIAGYPLWARIDNALVSCVIYLRQMFWPAGLAMLYPYSSHGPPRWQADLAALLLIGLSMAAWQARRKQPWLLAGWLWYLTMLAPVIGIIQVGEQAHADRYTYLPQIGIGIAITWLAAEWVARRNVDRAAAGSVMAGIVVLLMVCAWRQTSYWQNSETVWRRSLACTTNNESAHYSLANALLQEGKVDEAIIEYQQALAIRPAYQSAEYNLANAFFQQGKMDDAIAHYQIALALRPDDAEARINLATVLLQKGAADDALAQARQAADSRPAFAEAHALLGNVLMEKGNAAEAITQFQTALRIKPDEPEAANNLAWLLATTRQPALRNGPEAVRLAQRANELTGANNPMFLHTLAAALAEAGRFSEAAETARQALNGAEAQSNSALAARIQSEIYLYQQGIPLSAH
ncbi:MAG TPA: tetratricopeptide repeat protein [Verrucomicrobiae bacterium]|jgi:tetratricopeptide (TPR) repeat protein